MEVKIVSISDDQVIDDAKVKEVTLTSTLTNILTFSAGADTTTYTGLGKNTNIAIQSKTLSGIAALQIRAVIKDGSSEIILTKTLSVTVIAGPVTSMSIPYVDSGPCKADQTEKLYSNKHIIHASDKYGNPAQVRIVPSLINGTKHVVPKPNFGSGTGSIDTGTSFKDNTVNIFNDVTTEDRLIITPNADHSDHSYLGGWTIGDVLNDNELQLSETFTGSDESNLSYIIGSEKRFLGRDLVTATVTSPSGEYVTDENGTLLLEVCYDPKLAAHTFTLGAYAVDGGKRMGIATIENFRWNDFDSSEVTIQNDGADHNVSLVLSIANGDATEHLIDLSIVPSSIENSGEPNCAIDQANSNFHTNDWGVIFLAVTTDGNTTATEDCTFSWDRSAGNIYMEY
jgi:hypothetical protein